MNELRHLKDFQKILTGYKVSAKSKQTLQQTKFVLLAAPTSSGRNTIIRKLLNTNEYHYVVSDTTRKMRLNDGVMEQNGVEYWFRSEEEVLADLKAGKFIEAAIIHNQQVSGISIREIEKAKADNKIAITDIEINGVDTIMNLKPDAIAIFVLPPSFKEWQRRLKHRGVMDKEEVRRRLQSALAELAAALSHPYYHFVVNDSVEHAMEQIHAIAKFGHYDVVTKQKCKAIAESLAISTAEYLNNN